MAYTFKGNNTGASFGKGWSMLPSLSGSNGFLNNISSNRNTNSSNLPDYEIDISSTITTADNIKTKFGLYFDRGEATTALTTKFNKYNLPIPGNIIKSGRGYIFMTKPDLNLSGKNGDSTILSILKSTANTEYIAYSGYFAYLKTLPIWNTIKGYLDSSSKSTSPFIQVVTNSCFGFDPPDLTLKTEEGPDTFRGWKTTFARNSIESRKLPTFSLTFKLDNELIAYHLVKSWFEAIELQDQGILHRKEIYLAANVIDYMASMFYIVVAEDGETILFISKMTGCFPTKDPASIFSTNDTGMLDTSGQLKFSSEWQAIFYDTMSISIINDFNEIAAQGSDGSYHAKPPTYLEPYETGYWAATPVIVQDGGYYKLKWRDDRRSVSGKNTNINNNRSNSFIGTNTRNRLSTIGNYIGNFFQK